jgi:hypothetical protein
LTVLAVPAALALGAYGVYRRSGRVASAVSIAVAAIAGGLFLVLPNLR